MTIAEITGQLLGHFPPEERGIPDAVDYPGRNASVLAAMNGALQECFANSSPWVRQADRGFLVHAPATVTITVTQNSRDAEITDGWEAWMAGCSIVISGSANDNRITNDDDENVILSIPHDGASGSTSALVYGDCITLDADILAVFPPVRLDRVPIPVIPSGKNGPVVRSGRDFGFRPVVVGAMRLSGSSGRPTSYSVETWSANDTAAPAARLILAPAPAAAHTLDLTAMLKPPAITDVESADGLPIPHEFTESIFIPLALQRLKASPFYRSDPAKDAAIERDFAEARRQLKRLSPSRRSGIRAVTLY